MDVILEWSGIIFYGVGEPIGGGSKGGGLY